MKRKDLKLLLDPSRATHHILLGGQEGLYCEWGIEITISIWMYHLKCLKDIQWSSSGQLDM